MAYLWEVYLPAFNAEFAQPARAAGSAFVLCRDNCVRFEGLALQLPVDRRWPHYAKARVEVRRPSDGTLSVWHGPRKPSRYGPAAKPDSLFVLKPDSSKQGGALTRYRGLPIITTMVRK